MDKLMSALIIILSIGLISVQVEAAPRLTIDNTTLQPGENGILRLRLLDGEFPYAGVNAKILLPKGVSITGIAKGTLIANDFKMDWHAIPEGAGTAVTVLAYAGNKTFAGLSGVLLEIKIEVPANAPEGNHKLYFVNGKSGLSNENGSLSITHKTSAGDLNILDFNSDYDGDGMPNGWEINFGLNPFVDDSAEDPDGDGYSNIEEYLAGTDPMDQFSKPKGSGNSLPWLPLLLEE